MKRWLSSLAAVSLFVASAAHAEKSGSSAAVESSAPSSAPRIPIGLRLTTSSLESTASITGATRGISFGIGVDVEPSPVSILTLELGKVAYDGHDRTDLRLRLQHRHHFMTHGRFREYSILGVGLVRANVPADGEHEEGWRLDTELGAGAELSITTALVIFGELGLGYSRWLREPPSVLATAPDSSSEGYAELRAGLRWRF